MKLLTDLAQRLLPIMRDIRAKIALHHPANPALAPLMVLVWNRLFRLVARLDRLVVRWHAGTLRPARTRLRKPDPRPAPALRTPTRNFWLVRLVQPTIQLAQQVETYINSPEILALAAAAPQAGRIFRPLCRMLGIVVPAHLRLPAKPATVRAPRAARPRAARPPRPEPHRSSSPPHLRLIVPGIRRARS